MRKEITSAGLSREREAVYPRWKMTKSVAYWLNYYHDCWEPSATKATFD